MAIRRTIDRRGQRGAQDLDRVGDTGQSSLVETFEDRSEQVIAQGVDLAEHPVPGRRHPDDDHATVLRDAGPFDEPAFLDAIDEAGGARERHVEVFGQPAHRHVTIALEREQDVQLGHADPGPQRSLA